MMSIQGHLGNSALRATAALICSLALSAPVFAQHGGMHGGGGGGGGHSGFSGGGHASFGGGHASFGGGHSVGHGFSGPTHFSSPGGFSGYRGGYAPNAHFVAPGHISSFHGYRGSVAGAAAYRGGIAGRPGYISRPGYGPGFGRGGFGYYRPYWGGGWWRGCFWPRAYYWGGYPWFLGVLPAFYATYWWSGVPYYYIDNVYYTYNSGYGGYVATDPPPTGDAGDASSGDDSGSQDPGNSGAQAAPGPTNDVYMYPKNGQSEEQQATDRYECHKWAVAQSGFDPTRGSRAGSNSGDYRRAMAACLDGRGYSAR